MRDDKLPTSTDERIREVTRAIQAEMTESARRCRDKKLEKEIADKLERQIRENIYRLIPNIEEMIRVSESEIHISERLTWRRKALICYIPYIFTIRENTCYDMFVGTKRACQVMYKKNSDLKAYGYVATIHVAI